MSAAGSVVSARLRSHRGRRLVVLAGIAAVGILVGASATVAYNLQTGFDRAASRADLPDVIATFDPASAGQVAARARTLPDVSAATYEFSQAGTNIVSLPDGRYDRHSKYNGHAVVIGARSGPRGYALVAGHGLTGARYEAVIERGLASSWHIRVGDRIGMLGPGHRDPHSYRVVGIAVAPDNVAFPLAAGPRVYVDYPDAVALTDVPVPSHPVNQVLLWARDPANLPLLLEQARVATFGINGFQFVTQDGIRVLVDGAAGIVIALLAAFSLVALATAGIVLAATAYADAQKRLPAFGTMRALGGSRRQITASVALEAAAVAVPATLAGVVVGYLVARGPTGSVLTALNEFSAGWQIAWVLAACVLVQVAIVVGAAAWPAWRAAGRPPATLLRGGDVGSTPRGRLLPSGLFGLGMRMVVSRPLRALATVGVVAAAASVILLMLSLATLLDRLEHDPATVGKRYALTVPAPPSIAPRIAALPGVSAAAPRYEADAVDSFDLGESFQMIAYGGRGSRFENPPLQAGRREQAPDEAAVGAGLADALNLHVGSTLAAELPTGVEVRFRVTGIVSSLENQGLLAYVQPRRLLAADPAVGSSIAVDLDPGASAGRVKAEVAALGYPVTTVGGVTSHNAKFLVILANLLRTVAVVDALVCLFAVVQMLGLTATERSQAVAVLRAAGARPRQITQVFLGAAVVVVLAAAPLAVLLERLLLGPRTASLAAGYATISLSADLLVMAAVAMGLIAVAVIAALVVSRSAIRRPPAVALRGE